MSSEPAPQISPDFSTGSTEVGLERIRTRLLDLTNRNKLLNYRHPTASSLRVVNTSIEQAFQRLVENEKLAFVPVPENPEEDPIPAKDYAEQLGWNTSFDLDQPPSADNGRYLPALHYQEQLDTLSRKIGSAARTAVEESGISMLYLVFGFLEWFEADDSGQSHLAPLITVPVTLERSGGKGSVVESVVEYSGEDIETNLSLVERMRRDFGLEMPELKDDDTPETYFRGFQAILNAKKRWRIRPHITLALLSFGKLLMYRDLDPKTWPASESISKHSLVRQLFEGAKNSQIALADEYPIDAPELKPQVPFLIRDADSSQHSALIHALRGENLVLEGPPGTGKSQTITNLIAAALAKGKTVLFVSEKLAALEVVRRRLDDAGLGLFCLEVHSHKTKKGALLNDVAQRQKASGTFTDPRDLDRQLAIVEEKKRFLTQYSSLINKTIAPIGSTIFDILWARERFGQEISQHQSELGSLMLPVVVRFTNNELASTENFLSIYAQHLASVLGSGTRVEEHPWHWVGKLLSFAEEERVIGCLEELVRTLNDATEACRLLDDTAGIVLAHSLKGLTSTAYGLTLIPESVSLPSDLLPSCRDAGVRARLNEFIGLVERFYELKQQLGESVSDVDALLDSAKATRLSNAIGSVDKWGIGGLSPAQAKGLLNTIRDAAESFRNAQSSLQALLAVIGCEVTIDLPNAVNVVATLRALEDAPVDTLHLRQSALERDGTKPLLATAGQTARRIKETQASLSEHFDLVIGMASYSSRELVECSAALENTPWWNRLFAGRYKDAKKSFRQLSRNHKALSRKEMAHSLRAIAVYMNDRTQFDNHAGYKELLGPTFNGVDTPWESLSILATWYEEVFVSLPEHRPETGPFRHFLLAARAERLKAIKADMKELDDHRGSLEHTLSRASALSHAISCRSLMSSGSFEQIGTFLTEIAHDLAEITEASSECSIREAISLREIPGLLAAADECRRAIARTNGDAEAARILGDRFDGVGRLCSQLRTRCSLQTQSVRPCQRRQQTGCWPLSIVHAWQTFVVG